MCCNTFDSFFPLSQFALLLCLWLMCPIFFFQVGDAQPLPLSDKMEQMFIEKLLWNYNDKTLDFFCHANLDS